MTCDPPQSAGLWRALSQAHRPLRCAVAGAFVIIAETSRSQDPSISASGSFSLRLLNRARLCICNRQRQVLSARPSQEQKQTLKASRHLEACVSAGRFGFALPRRPVFVFLLFSDLPPSLVACCILFFFLPLRGVTQFRHLFFSQGESRHAAFFFFFPARLSVIAPLCLALLDHVCLCLSCLCRRRRQRERVTTLPMMLSLKQLLRPKSLPTVQPPPPASYKPSFSSYFAFRVRLPSWQRLGCYLVCFVAAS
ncbi:hypothetical protein M441DRAFT_217182 [Trichoderma asperellum CBS 433.97]|uniref:Transmembrane protein n=1 Tax=Trichoderma asperellum (strain ATCC 204424 / CBS 433.97 / NBRC 101777) TaxID=1042311 RepID=A0A2T3ZNQ9_TRIA4|nr:hypothetical protein M441DRAFT_217182 [Trichoderma asperellum CBS 433.97]PTB46453.1 hypothetical protein M441DRAFT_217182 [Trichoderma asperellum CBS 433.97]